MTVEQEFTEFAIARTPQLYRAAWLLCGDAHRAEDLVQEALAKVYAAWGRRVRNPAAYAQTVLVRTFISGQRRRSAHERPVAEVPDSAEQGDDATLRLVVRGALDELAPLDRAIVVLRYLEDLPAEEVGHVLGLSPGAVRKRAARALDRTRDRLAHLTTSEEIR